MHRLNYKFINIYFVPRKTCLVKYVLYFESFTCNCLDFTPQYKTSISRSKGLLFWPLICQVFKYGHLWYKKKYCICITTLEEINIQSFYVFNLESMRTIWKVKTSWKVIFVNFWQLYIACYNLWHMQTTFHPFSHRQIAQRASISFEVMFSGSPPYKCVIHVHIMVAVLYIWAVNVTLKLWLSRH